MTNLQPKDFFNELFQDQMYQLMADETDMQTTEFKVKTKFIHLCMYMHFIVQKNITSVCLISKLQL